LKLKCDLLLSTSAFNFNVRGYIMAMLFTLLALQMR